MIYLRSFETELDKIPGDMLREVFLHIQRTGNTLADPNNKDQVRYRGIDLNWFASTLANQEELVILDRNDDQIPADSPFADEDFCYQPRDLQGIFDGETAITDTQAQAITEIITNFNRAFSGVSAATIEVGCWKEPWKQYQNFGNEAMMKQAEATAATLAAVSTQRTADKTTVLKAYHTLMHEAIEQMGGMDTFVAELEAHGYSNQRKQTGVSKRNVRWALSETSLLLNQGLFNAAMQVFDTYNAAHPDRGIDTESIRTACDAVLAYGSKVSGMTPTATVNAATAERGARMHPEKVAQAVR